MKTEWDEKRQKRKKENGGIANALIQTDTDTDTEEERGEGEDFFFFFEEF